MTDPVAPVPPAAPTPAPVVAGPKQTLSLVGFIVGLVAFLTGWTAIFGILAGIAAIIICVMARKREPAAPKWMWIVGLIAGIIGLLWSLGTTIFWIIYLVTVASTVGTLGTISGY